MLLGITAHNFLLLRQLDLEFGPGLNVLTGETGTGKSLLIDALGFVLGRKTRSYCVGPAGKQGSVAASFGIDKASRATAILEELGFPGTDELLLRRVVYESGRSVAYLNDRRCTLATLHTLAPHLVEIHGQSDETGLLHAATQRRLLDRFSRNDELRHLTSRNWQELQELTRSLSEARSRMAQVENDRAYACHAADELEVLAPYAGEESELNEQRLDIIGSKGVRNDIDKALALIGESGAEASIADGLRWLERVAGTRQGLPENVIPGLDRALVELIEARRCIEDYRRDLDYDPYELERIEERLFGLRSAARKFRVGSDELQQLAAGFRRTCSELAAFGSTLTDLQDKVDSVRQDFDKASHALSASRKSGAQRLEHRMRDELDPLKLENAKFSVKIKAASGSGDGIDEVTFLASTNPGMPPGPISKIASGGELSRFTLALKVCLLSDGQQGCMVFDEIDRGVGGATADAIGRRLQILAGCSQVFAVTHSPQVAAYADRHWKVEKPQADGLPQTRILLLEQEERFHEVARMLAGEEISTEACAAAASLIQAGTSRKNGEFPGPTPAK